MNLASHLFPGVWLWVAAALAAAALWHALRQAPWARLRSPALLNGWMGSIVALALVWTMNAGIRDGLNLHFLGATAATLMFGPELAFVALALALVASALNGSVDWAALGLNLLVMAGVPVLFTQRLLRLVERLLPPNYFIYIFVLAFAGAGVAVMLVGALATGLLALAGAYPVPLLAEEYLPFLLLLGISEAWMSGMTMTLLVVFRPDWVFSFDDRRYLAKDPAARMVREPRNDKREKTQ